MVLQIHNITAISNQSHRESIKRMEEVANTITNNDIKDYNDNDDPRLG